MGRVRIMVLQRMEMARSPVTASKARHQVLGNR